MNTVICTYTKQYLFHSRLIQSSDFPSAGVRPEIVNNYSDVFNACSVWLMYNKNNFQDFIVSHSTVINWKFLWYFLKHFDLWGFLFDGF